METETYPLDTSEFITDELLDLLPEGLHNQDSVEAVITAMLQLGWQPPLTEHDKFHPRGRLRDMLNDQFYDWFKAVGRSVPRSISERVYHWHLGEARAIAHTKVARELNLAADDVEAEALAEQGTVSKALEWVAGELRTRADRWEDTVVDPKHGWQGVRA